MKKPLRFWKIGFAVGLVLSLFLVGCQSNDKFVQQAVGEFFPVDFNPDYIDVLWVVDDRSPMYNNRAHLVSEATKFFQRLDGSTNQYRMGIISADTVVSKGRLKPDGAPYVLTKSFGTVEQRAQSFSTILSQLINLHTGGEANGFEASRMALTSSFIPTAGVPLVLVYISDGDDHSVPANGDAVDYFADQLVALKGGRKELVQVYSINLMDLNGNSPTAQNRCTTLYQAERDVLPNFEDRYFRMADKFGGEKSDLCGAFASLIKLDGLRLKELPTRFALKDRPRLETVVVTVLIGDQSQTVANWTYDSATNEIVLASPPPAGSTLYVIFDPSGR